MKSQIHEYRKKSIITMSKHIISHIRKTISISFLTALFGSISMISYANGGNEPVHELRNTSADVKYIAGTDGDGLFNIVYNNAAGSRFSIIVLDEYGNQIYQNVFSDRKFDRKFKLADPEASTKLTFVIRNYGDKSVQRFEVEAINKMVEDVEVREVQ